MSVRSLTDRLVEERSESRRRNGLKALSTTPEPTTESMPSGLFKGVQPEPPEPETIEPPVAAATGLKPRVETPSSAIPGGIADRFRLRSQRVSDISRSIDAYTTQLTGAPESDEQNDDDSETAPITIELRSH